MGPSPRFGPKGGPTRAQWGPIRAQAASPRGPGSAPGVSQGRAQRGPGGPRGLWGLPGDPRGPFHKDNSVIQFHDIIPYFALHLSHGGSSLLMFHTCLRIEFQALGEPLLSSSLFDQAPRQGEDQQLTAEMLLAGIVLSGAAPYAPREPNGPPVGPCLKAVCL